MTDLDILEPRLQGLERRMNRVDTFALGWVLEWWWRSRRWETHEP
jgi:hypothetical protein